LLDRLSDLPEMVDTATGQAPDTDSEAVEQAPSAEDTVETEAGDDAEVFGEALPVGEPEFDEDQLAQDAALIDEALDPEEASADQPAAADDAIIELTDIVDPVEIDPEAYSAPVTLAQGTGPGTPAQVLESGPGRLVLGIEPTGDGLLVVSQPFYPGWFATVDGEPVPVHRVDYLLQSVQVQAGSRQVELFYRLSPVPGICSLAFLVACIGGVFVKKRHA
jgi:hypothetical protein